MLRFIARYVAMFRLLWLTPQIKGEFKILEVSNGPEGLKVLLPLNEDTKANGIQSLFWDSRKGHALVEPDQVVASGRWFRVHANYGLELKATAGAWLSGWLGERPEDFGLTNVEEVRLPNGTLGLLTNLNSTKWIIHVHGRKTLYGETLRNFKLLHEIGFRQLAISHETDPKPYGLGKRRSTLGLIEWRQVLAAVSFAGRNGATEVVLFGWSLGGMMVGQFMRKVKSSIVVGAIFDSPMFDVRNTLRLQALLSGYEAKFADEVCTLIANSTLLRALGYPKMIVDDLSLAMNRLECEVPMLAMYSKNDGYVAFEDVEQFAKINSGAKLVEFQGARHCRLKNSDPGRYEQEVKLFLAQFGI